MKSYWFEGKKDIEFIDSEHLVKIAVAMGHGIIAIINTEEDRRRVRSLIDELKEFDYIKTELHKFYEVIKDIHTKSEELSKDIGKNIIRFIELEEYDDMCKICKKF